MTSRRARTWSPLLLAGTVAIAGCAAPVTSAQCVDWVVFDTPADAAAEADAVAIGTAVERTGSASVYGQDVDVWRVDVAEWMQGEGDSSIDVVSVPRTCESGAPYPDGDPLDRTGDVLLFLRMDGERWQTVTPYQGVLPAPVDGEIPATWP